MGAGDRIKFYRASDLSLGFGAARFPYAVTIYVRILLWGVSIGFGKPYDFKKD